MSSDPVLIDANALVDFFLGEEPLKKGAEDLRRRHPYWLTLPLCRYEFGNALRTYTRRGHIDEGFAENALQQGLGMVRFCQEVDAQIVLAEANASGLTFYDAAYVACARLMGTQLYTRDGQILKNCPDVALPVAEL